jgi:Methylamine utilisation protein MauE
VHNKHKTSQTNALEYLKFIAVIAVITLVSVWLYNDSAFTGPEEFLRNFMGVFFVVFAGFKLAGYKMFTTMFASYDIAAKRSPLYAKMYPFFELSLGLAYLMDVLPVIRDWAVLIVLGVGSIGVIQEIYHRRSGVYCACLGNVIKLPLSTVSLVEDLTMVVMALFMIVN